MEEVALRASIDLGSDGAKSLKQLKQEFKETQKELDGLQQGSERYVATLKKLGGIKDDIGDLNDEIKAFNPEGKVQAFGNVVNGIASGFQAATGAAALFGGESKEIEKALLKVQAVMLFTEGIKGLTGLKDSFKSLTNILGLQEAQIIATNIATKIATVATRVWNAVLNSSPIVALTVAIGLFVAGVYALSKALASNKSEVETLTAEYENLKKANELLNHQLDNEIKLLESLGGKEKEINALKREKLLLIQKEAEASARLSNQKLKEAINETSLLEGINKLFGQSASAAGIKAEAILKANEEVKKSNQEVADASVAIQVLDNTIEKEAADKRKKNHEEAIKLEKERLAEHKKYLDAKADADNAEADRYTQLQKETKEAIKALEAQLKADEEALAEDKFNKSQTEFYASIELKAEQNQFDLEAQLTYLEAQKQQELSNIDLTESERLLIKHRYAEKAKELETQNIQQSIAGASYLTNSLQSLSDSLFAVKRANLKKGSAEDEKAAKQQFKINKALALSGAIITGIQSVMAAYASGLATPIVGPATGAIYAVLAGVIAAANIAKIASSKYEGGGGGGASSMSSTSLSSASAPTINAPQNSNTLLNPDGSVQQNNNSQQPIKVFVSEGDIREKQNRVDVLEEQSIIR